ncbi:MAG: hypothetical protein Q4E75_05210 [bacterium]|nr:hypothetical protein [bacterium]
MNVLKKMLIIKTLQKKYGKVFNFIDFGNGNVTFVLKNKLNYYDKEYLELPKKADVIKIMKKYYKKNNNIEVKTILAEEDVMKNLEINCNGEKLKIESCNFYMNLKVDNVDNLVLSDDAKVYGNLEVNANKVNFKNANLVCYGITKINANKIVLTCSKLILSDISELNAKEYLHLLLTHMVCIYSSSMIKSNNTVIEKSDIDCENLIIKSNNLELKSNKIDASDNIEIDSQNIESSNNKIVSDKLTVNNKNNNGLNNVSANLIIYNNQDVTYMANRKLSCSRKKIIQVLRDIKNICEVNKKDIIDERIDEIEKEIDVRAITKLLNK